MKKENNPFLSNIFPPDFSAMTPEAADKAITFALNEARQNILNIENLPDAKADFGNVVRALDNCDALLTEVWNIANHIESVCSTPEMREVLNRRDAEVSDFSSSICINEKLWHKIKIVRDSGIKFEGEEKTLLDETVRDFVENGANLSASDKHILQKLDAELSTLTRKFSENALDALNSFELNIAEKSELDGLPESALALAQKKAEAKKLPGYLITLDAPIFAPVLSHCKNEALRKTLWLEYSNLCAGGKFDNEKIMRQIIELRDKKAKLLGNENFADYVLNSRMARTGKNALKFVEELKDKMLEAFASDISKIEEFAGKSPIEPWNGAFLAENMRRQKYDFDTEAFRPYITLESALKGAFSLAKSLYGLDIKKSNAPSWHKSVMFFDVLGDGGSVKYDPASNTLTLTNAGISGAPIPIDPRTTSGILSDMDLTLELVGNNSVTGKDARDASYGILVRFSRNLVLTGSGTLDVTSGSGSGNSAISATGITMLSGTIRASGTYARETSSCGVSCSDLTIEGGTLT
ncbi:MAG: hypothetical protein J6T16_08090, partial [Opitutales bacterium]|nr:hypothetical protein [Opitutales bacterium]